MSDNKENKSLPQTDFKTTPAPSAPKHKDRYAAEASKPSKATSRAQATISYVQIALGLAVLSSLTVVVLIVLVSS